MRVFFLSCMIFCLASAIQAQTKYEQAEDYYTQALARYRNEEYPAALELLVLQEKAYPLAKGAFLRGMVYEREGKGLRAIAAFEETLRLDPDYVEALFQKAILYLNYGNPEQAIKDFNALLKLDRISTTHTVFFETDELSRQQNQVMTLSTMKSRWYHYRGKAFEKTANLNQAMKDYNLAISLDTVPEFLISRALLQQKMNVTVLAKADLRHALRINPNHPLAWYNLALIDEETEIPDALISDEQFAPLLGLLASRAMEVENYPQAIKYLDKSISQTEDVLSLVNRGRAQLKLKNYEAARADFNRVRAIDTERVEALYLLGNTYFYEGRPTEALAYYDQYLIVDPYNAMVWYNGALSQLRLKQKEEACHYLQRAISLGMLEADQMKKKFCQ